MTTTLTARDLNAQTLDSKLANIQAEVWRQLDMQFGYQVRQPRARLQEDARLTNADLDRFGTLLAQIFPFFPAAYVHRAQTIQDLVYVIAQESGSAAGDEPAPKSAKHPERAAPAEGQLFSAA